MKRAILRLFCFFLCTLPQSSQSLTLKFGNLKPHPPPSRRDDAIPKLISHRLCFIASFLTSFHCLPKTCTTRQLLSVCKVYGPSIGRTLRPVFGPLFRGRSDLYTTGCCVSLPVRKLLPRRQEGACTFCKLGDELSTALVEIISRADDEISNLLRYWSSRDLAV